MGALTLSRKRSEDYSTLNNGLLSSNFNHISKKQKLCDSLDQTSNQRTSSKSTISRFFLYPKSKPQFKREVHAPCRQSRFGFSGYWSKYSFKGNSVKDKMGNSIGGKLGKLKSLLDNARESALNTFRSYSQFAEGVEVRDESKRKMDGLGEERKCKEVIDVNDDLNNEHVSEDSSIEEVEILEDGRNEPLVVLDQEWKETDEIVENRGIKSSGKGDERNFQPSSSSLVTDLSDSDLKLDSTGKMLNTLPLTRDVDICGVPWYSKLLDYAQKRDVRLQDLNFQIKLKEKLLESYQSLRPPKKAENLKKDVVAEAFTPLTEEEEAEVSHAFSNSNRRRVLVTHENSNIDITGELLQCLRPGAWLNDEIINVYLELLKERESRDPQKFLKCHFFNTFFYKKLTSGRDDYNFQSVRRWTSHRKLGYSLLDCDKIFVPIHKQIHWCLAIINKKDQKFQYLDSLGGFDTQVTKVLARYYVDEVKDKSGKDIDVSSWGQEFVEDLPEQENGFDCGMFMIKYADFYSRGVGLCFHQENMPYFRLRTAKEILRLRAD